MVSRGNSTSHQLPGVAGSLPGSQSLWKDLEGHDSPTPSGQCHSSDIYKSEGRHSFWSAVPIGYRDVDLVHIEEHNTNSRTPSGATSQESRSIRDHCDWMLDPSVFKGIQEKMGPLEVDLFASRLTRQLPHFFSWRADPEASAIDAFMQDWSQLRGFANPP